MVQTFECMDELFRVTDDNKVTVFRPSDSVWIPSPANADYLRSFGRQIWEIPPRIAGKVGFMEGVFTANLGSIVRVTPMIDHVRFEYGTRMHIVDYTDIELFNEHELEILCRRVANRWKPALPHPLKMDSGQLIRELIVRGYTQEKIAKLCGMSQGWVSRASRGRGQLNEESYRLLCNRVIKERNANRVAST